MFTEPTTHAPDLDEGRTSWDRALKFLWVEVTNRCDLECVHCYVDSGPTRPLRGTMTCQDYESVLAEAALLGCRRVQFLGGEPTLYPDLGRLVTHARTLNFTFVEVFTNGAGLTDAMCQFLKIHDVHLAFSVHGSSAEAHEKVTGRAGSYRRTLKRIRTAVDTGLSVRVGVNPIDDSQSDVQLTTDLLKSIGVSEIRFDRVRGVGRGQQLVDTTQDPMSELCGSCWQGQLAVDVNGDVYPCVFSRFHNIGNVRDGLDNLLRTPALRRFRREIRRLHDVPRSQRARCNPDDCNPYCNPNCNPFEDCVPQCLPW